jgi:1,4-dihydroxy-2-naphthoate octaprenyltransferase
VIASAAAQPRSRLGVWWLGARPRTLVAAVVPVLVGAAWTGRPSISIPRTLLALVVALGLQVAVNYANDYSDGVRGVDTAARTGPARLVASGMAPARDVAIAAGIAIVVAAAAGVVLALLTSAWLIAIGAAAIGALLLYSGGPRPYAARGLGEVAVFIFFGIVATAGTAYVQQQRINVDVLWVAIPVGLLACALLMINNLRDIPTDRAAGKRTLAVRIGARATKALLPACVVAAVALPSIGAAFGALPRLAFVSLVAVPFAWPPLRTALTAQGRGLIPALIGITRLQLVFGVLLAAALLAA